ncbi:flagellin [Idiomarina sp.]|uniref:flagellin N-terminal helical domain-containing protein n=1 Tax=Idiomarina sp. TaxID=1874361 RepID=UPI0025C08C68|nr:flagellin [Idiomarina sp.]
MALYVNTNVSSINAQNQLVQSGNKLDQAFERLSSGLRINSAADDAAGLQISNRLTSQVNGLNVATRNANDGVSLVQTAEGAMSESTNILQRMRELALQSANGSNSDEDRGALQKEISSLQSELTRISETTSFGGQNLLDGSFGSRDFQVGSQSNQTIGFELADISASAIGAVGKGIDGTSISNLGIAGTRTTPLEFGEGDAFEVSIDGTTSDISLSNGMSAKDLAGELNKVDGVTGVAAQNVTELSFGSNTTGSDSLTLTIAGVTVADDITVAAGATPNADETVADIFSKLDGAAISELEEKGITVTQESNAGTDSDDRIIVTDSAGNNVDISMSITGGGTDGLTGNIQSRDADGNVTGGTETVTAGTNASASASVETTGFLDFSSATVSSDSSIVNFKTTKDATSSGFNTAAIDDNATLTAEKLNSVENINIDTQGGAQSAIDVIDGAIAQIDGQRADLGAVQNRFESTISNLSNISENVSAARSRVRDADFAAETAKLTQAQIIQQASTTILAQANQRPQAALSLLG